jgi:2'-5' RNA ligase
MPTTRALVVFPEGNGLHVIESLRRRFDPLATVIAAHSTLVFPFTSEISEIDLRAHIELALEGQPPFRVRFEGVLEVENEYLFLDAVVGRELLFELHDRLYRGLLSEYRSTAHVYRPHITLGRIRDGEARRQALSAARRLTPVVDEIVRGVSVFRLGENPAIQGTTIPLGV